ncbi:hypothetical protein [Sedimentitalea arenosa]|jgi:hypothetical protein|nr:hypothetical protein [Arenibacterium arenosum]
MRKFGKRRRNREELLVAQAKRARAVAQTGRVSLFFEPPGFGGRILVKES